MPRPYRYFLIVFGAVFLLCGTLAAFYTASFVRTSQTAPGTVLRLVRTNTGKGNSMLYFPIFTFRTPDGSQHLITSNNGSGRPAYRIGDPVTVLYHLDAPESGKISSFSELWLLPLIFSSAGLLLLGIGIAVLRFTQSPPALSAGTSYFPTGFVRTVTYDGAGHSTKYQQSLATDSASFTSTASGATPTRRRVFFITGLALLLIGLFLTGKGIVKATQRATFIHHAQTAPATIVALVLPPVNAHSEPGFSPVFTFRAATGATQTVTADTASNPPAFHVGEAVTILYDPAHPQGARISSLGELWFGPVAFLILGSAMLFTAAFLLRNPFSKTALA